MAKVYRCQTTTKRYKARIVCRVFGMYCILSFNEDHWACPWWRYQMETFSALLAICAGNSPVTGEFPAQRPVTRTLMFFSDLHLNTRFGKQWWDWWFEIPSRPLWRHSNVFRLILLGLLNRHPFVPVKALPTLIARSMGPTWGPSGADRTQMGTMLAPRTLLSGYWIKSGTWWIHSLASGIQMNCSVLMKW